jgi:hypothetical protein
LRTDVRRDCEVFLGVTFLAGWSGAGNVRVRGMNEGNDMSALIYIYERRPDPPVRASDITV